MQTLSPSALLLPRESVTIFTLPAPSTPCPPWGILPLSTLVSGLQGGCTHPARGLAKACRQVSSLQQELGHSPPRSVEGQKGTCGPQTSSRGSPGSWAGLVLAQCYLSAWPTGVGLLV